MRRSSTSAAVDPERSPFLSGQLDLGPQRLPDLVGAICVGVGLLAALLLRQPQSPATVAEREMEAEVVLEQM
jgi:hypothetical protein